MKILKKWVATTLLVLSLGVSASTGVFANGTSTSSSIASDDFLLPIPTSAMHRLYNPNSGEHFYTAATYERDVLINLGWHGEGIGWETYLNRGEPVYRLYNPNAGDHHYTMSAGERDYLVKVGWRYEGEG